MLIKVIIGAFVLLFLGFFPTLYTMFHFYRKCGEFNDEVIGKSFFCLFVTFAVWFIVIYAFIVSYSFITQNS